jgi:starch-binding outer membrane protein, SusD/RagB family
MRDQIKGEAYFLRAWFYHNLLRVYGGVPLVDRTFALDDDMRVARNSFEETVNFFVADGYWAAALLKVPVFIVALFFVLVGYRLVLFLLTTRMV